MDEQRMWIKSRRKKRLRALAVILCLCLLGTTYPDILEALSVFAEGTKDAAVYVTDFARLPDEVREQTVPVGTDIKNLELPDTLEAVIIETVQEEEIPPEEATPSPTQAAPTPSKETDASEQNPSGATENGQNPSGDETENGQQSSGATENGQNPSGETENGQQSSGGATGDEQNPSGGATENGQQSSGSVTEETGKKEENTAPAQEKQDAGTQEPASKDNATGKTEGGSAPSAQAESAGLTQETHSVAMQEYQTGLTQETHSVAMQEYQTGNAQTIEKLEAADSGSDTTDSASDTTDSGSDKTATASDTTATGSGSETKTGNTDTAATAPTNTTPGASTGSNAGNAPTGATTTTPNASTGSNAANAPTGATTTTTAPTGSNAANSASPTSTPEPADAGEEKSVVIENVTWKSKPGYDEDKPGEYIFTAILPDGYALASGVSLPKITVTVEGESEQARELDALLELLRALPDPEKYLTYDEAADEITTNSEIIDERQLRKAREAADEYLEKYPDSDINVTCGADIDKNRDDNAPSGKSTGTSAAETGTPSGESTGTSAAETGAPSGKSTGTSAAETGASGKSSGEATPETGASDVSEATLADLLTRLEGLEHIRDTEADCMDAECLYHYPQFVKERMDEDEIPVPLTMEDLVEDFGIEEPERSPAPVSDGAPARRSRARLAAAPRLNPQTLMMTNDNENNAHTGTADGDIDDYMSRKDGNHPIELTFTLNELPAQSAYLAVKAYDVDEDYGEHDYVYLNDDIYQPMNLTDSEGKTYNSRTIGYLAGTNDTWNTSVLEIPLEKLVKGKNVISVTVAEGWCVGIDWMQLILDGGAADDNITEFSLKLKDSATAGGNVTVNADVIIRQRGTTEYITEYTLTQNATGNALDACFGKAKASEQVSLTLPLDSPSGAYTITGMIKDPADETIKAVDKLSFWFTKGVGLGPAISHTLTPDTLTNQNVTIRVSAKDVTEVKITDVAVPSPTKTVTANGSYDFTVTYKQDGASKSLTYSVQVNNIDKTPPVITYTPITVPEETPQAEVQALFKEALSASDDRKLAENPLTCTLPANISYLPGTKNITVTAADAAGNTATKTCAVTVTAKPLQLTMGRPTAVSGSRDSFALKAVLTHTGPDTITKTGFVWGVMPNPTLEVKNGTVATASPVKTKGAAISGTATGIAYGVTYYARAYATLQNGSTIYSDSMPFGSGVPSYGTFSVSKVSGSTFTITRTGGADGEQTVYYRTVNGSAIGGTHFTHAAGGLVFADGETSKTVTVSEKGVTAAYGGRATTSYSNADRTYSLEIYRVDGGGQLDANKANRSKTRTMAKNSNYTVRRSLYTGENERSVAVNNNNKWVADNTDRWWRKVVFINDRGKNAAQGNKNFNVQRTMDVGTANEKAYIKATAEGFFYRLWLDATETDSGYEHVWISNHAPNSMRGPANDNHTDDESIPLNFSAFGHAFYTGRWEIGFHNTGTKDASFPSEAGLGHGWWTENILSDKDGSRITGDNNWVIYNINETAHVWFAANGNKKNMWYVNSYKDWLKIRDTKEPQLVGVAPMAGGAYLPGDTITVALVFDEIVDSGYSRNIGDVSINTNVGTLAYAGGVNTNVLYFTGTVQSGSLNGSSALKVNSINNSSYIKDMCDGGSGASSYSGNTNVIVDASKPSVTIAAQTSGSLPQHKAKVTSSENKVRYAWTKDASLPAAGWQTANSGVILTERRGAAGTSETWYLHVLATASSGAVTHKYQQFIFLQPDITAASVRAGNTATSADVSDVWKKEKYIVAQYAGAQTSGAKISLSGPQMGTQTISAQTGAAAFRVTKNGAYTLTLTDSYNNVVTKTIEVKKIDTQPPTAAIQSGSQMGNGVTHNSVSAVITPSDTGGSGVMKVEYAWTNNAGAPSASDWKVLSKAADGSYQTTYNATETTKTTKYLQVRVTDNAGNVSLIQRSGPYEVIRQATGNALPTITVTENPGGWAKKKTLNWTAKAGTGSGAGTIQSVTVPAGEAAGDKPAAGTGSGSCTVTENGNYRFTVTDSNGNTVSTQVTVTTIDNEAPKLTKVTAEGGKTARIALEGVNDNLTRVLDERGNFTGMSGSGVETREYQYGNGSWQEFSDDSFSPNKNGTYKIRLTDAAGNVSETYSVTLSNLDKTEPVVTCTIKAEKNASGWYTVYPLPVELTYADNAGDEGGASGIASVQYKWVNSNGSYPSAGLSSLNAAAVAGGKYTVNLGYYDNAEAYYLYYKVTDKTGNVTQGYSAPIKKDSYKGSASVTGPDKGQRAEDGLLMKLNSLVYGPSGGEVKYGTWAETGPDELGYSIPGHETGQITWNDAQSGFLGYTAKTPGSNYFRFYPAAADGKSYYWAFYVRKVTFDSQGGSAVEPQLVWHDSTNAVKCTVTEPAVPTRTGYRFDGWYTDAACTADNKFNFDTQLRADTTLYAKWTAETYEVCWKYTMPDGNGGTTGWQSGTALYTYGEGYALPEVPDGAKDWMDKGFAFDGWYETENFTGPKYTAVGKTATEKKTYYGRFKDVEAPKIIEADLVGGFNSDYGWHWGGTYFVIRYSDNNGVADVTASILVDGVETTDGIIKNSVRQGQYDYLLQEGVHTYQWKLVDAAGNVALSEKQTHKYDVTRPETGTITYDGVAGAVKVTDSERGTVYYLCGNKEVVLSVPVKDALSGVDILQCNEREKGDEGDGEKKKEQLSGENEEMVKLTFGTGTAKEMWKFCCFDKAGVVSIPSAAFANPFGAGFIWTNGAWIGVIVEDTPPNITIADNSSNSSDEGRPLSEGWYESQPSSFRLRVNDTGATGKTQGNAISSGIKQYAIYINGEKRHPTSFNNKIQTMWYQNFSLGADEKGVVNITVIAEDYAGNVTTQSVNVKIKGTEMKPAAKPDYPNDALSALAPDANYQITIGGGTPYVKTADKNGRIPFVLEGEEGGAGDMCGKSISIVKLGDGTNTQNSAPLSLAIEERPAAIPISNENLTLELAKDAENAKINLNLAGVTGTKEYIVDGGTAWTEVPSDNVIQNLKSGNVTVRVKATDSAPHGLKTTKNISESTGTITAVFDLNYSGVAGQPEAQSGKKGSDVLVEPAAPSRDGYDFMGWYMETACENEWRFTAADGTEAHKVRDWRASKASTTFDPVQEGDHYKITLYAKWRENVKPTLTPKLTTGAGGTEAAAGENWYHNLTLTADYSDNVEVTKLSVSVDNGDYKELDKSSATHDSSNPAVYHYTYTPVLEGSHTYRFKAEDEAGNVTEAEAVTAKLDTVSPELGEADVSNGYHSFWDWIVKNESLQIKVPVTDKSAGSGIEASGMKNVAYVLTPEGGSAQTAKNAELSGDKAVIQIDPDFKGTVQITAYDNAGNKAEKTIGTDGIHGVIVEDNAPEVTILADREILDTSSTRGEADGIAVSTAHYNSAPRLYVKVTDDKIAGEETTSGLKSVTWKINNGAEHQSGMNFETDTIKTWHSFTISALEGMDGTVNVTVKAVDQAGNETTVTQTVHIKTKEPQPAPQIDYRKEILTGLVANAAYKVLGTDGNEEEITADGSGNIKIKEEWFGREVQICKAGDGTTTLDSVKTDVKPAARPAPPRTEAKESETIKAKADGIIAAADASGLILTTLEYSTDGGENWNPVTAEMLTDGKLTGCAAGAWLFRVPACDTAPYGETTEVIIGTGKTLTVSFEENGGSEVSEITGLSWHDRVEKPEDPVREGYEFVGWYQEDTLENIWHFEGEDTVTVMEGDITLYAKWRDNVFPALGAVLVSPRSNGSADGGQWYNNLSIALTYSDNTAVTGLSVSVDGGAYAPLEIGGAAVAGKAPDGNVQYRLDDNNLTEGKHTYVFQAVDEGGNETTTGALTARLDTTNPEAGEASYEIGHKNLLDWIIRKESLLITVPVTDMGSDGKAGSGVESVAYTLTPVGADGNSDESKAIDGNAKIKKVSDGEFTAEIAVPADFKGTVKVTAADEAGNIAAEKTLGVDGGGIIVEDNAPEVSFMTGGLAVTGDFYENAQDIAVTVDDTGDGITGGIASVQYAMKGEDGKTNTYTVGNDYTTSLTESDSFTVPANVFRPGVNVLTVTAVDNAGNSASVPVTVKIKRPEPTPDPKIDYVAERLTGLFPNAEYKIADVGMRADAKGSVPIDESWIGTKVSVIRMPGTAENTVSAAKSMDIPDRPEAPQVEIEDETYPNAGDGILTMTETGKVYQFSPDGGTWTDAETDEERRITGLAAKDYYVRARAIENMSFRSKEGTVTVGTTPPTPYNAPDIEIDYENEKLTGLVPEAEYIVEYVENKGDADKEEVVTVIVTADKDGNIPVDETWLGKEPLSVVQQGNGKEKSDSLETVLAEGTLPVRPGAPSPSGEDETGIQTGAKLTDLEADTAYDISKDGGKTWLRKTADANGVITGVAAPGTYIVRVAAVGGFKSPESGEVTVDGYHIPVTFVANSVTAGTSWAYYGEAPEKIPAVPKKADAGDKTYVGEWCADESGTPGNLESITAATTFYACYTVGYNVNLKEGAGYGLTAAPGSATPVKEGGSFTLKFSLKSGYQKTAAFAVKVDGVKIELAEDGTYTIENIWEDHSVTVEGIVAVEKPSGSSGHHSKDDDDKTDETTPGGTVPGSTIPGGTDGTNPGGTNPGGTEGTNPGGTDGTNPGGGKPDGSNPGGTNPGGTKPGENEPGGTTPDGKYPVTEVPAGKTPGGNDFPENVKLPGGSNPDGTGPLTVMDAPVKIEDGKLVMIPAGPDGSSADGAGGTGTDGSGSGTDGAAPIATGNIPGMAADGVALLVEGGGTVTVTVICEDEAYTAGVRDTVAVANAVLTPEQIELIGNGEAIEILIDVKDITDSIQPQDRDVIEDGIKACREELPGLTLGMYIDISMFIKIGAGGWDAVTETKEPIDVVIGVPEELKADGRKFYIIRSHDGAYTLLPDTDDEPDTITVSTNLFSAYAIAYEEAEGAGAGKCGLCHICPTFLGICYFIWLAVIVTAIVIVWILIRRKKKEEEEEA